MEKSEVPENYCPSSEDTSQLNRNRSFKCKQLVRSRAIRESASPPRTLSPTTSPSIEIQAPEPTADDIGYGADAVAADNGGLLVENATSDVSSRSDCSDNGITDGSNTNVTGDEVSINPVHIQITCGQHPPEPASNVGNNRWRPLLTQSSSFVCVCGACGHCPYCRGRRRKQMCPIKQDSGIMCSDDCPDCSDSELTGGSNGNTIMKSKSVDSDEPTYYCRCPERKEKPKNLSISRTDSEEKFEPTGQDLVNFIKETLNKSSKDRVTLLRIEKELQTFMGESGRGSLRFPVMSSYGRMLVHRVAALFQLRHQLDQASKTCVLVSKPPGARMPCCNFRQWCSALPPSPQRHAPGTLAKSILKRDNSGPDRLGADSLSANRSKSLEQREKDYEKVRRRIFSEDNCIHDETQWPWINSGPVKLLTPNEGRNKLLKVQSLENDPRQPPGRGPVSKSHSFGGYGGETPLAPPTPRALSRHGDLVSSSWRLSPSSSGYKTLSLRSTDSVTPSPNGGASPEPSVCNDNSVVWAVTDLCSVPPGAIVIHPQTGRPVTNPDGSVYHFDPANPPVLYLQPPEQQRNDTNCDKKRGRLEKQHSFIDSDVDSQQQTDACTNNCCCDCRKTNTNQKKQTVEKISQQDKVIHQKPTSPCKSRYDTHNETQTNRTYQNQPQHRPTYEPANHVPDKRYESTNQRYDGTNQRYIPKQRSFEHKNQYDASKLSDYGHKSNEYVPNHRVVSRQESQEMPQYVMQQQIYNQPFRNDETTSPAQGGLVQGLVTAEPLQKVTAVPTPEPNIRALSMTNVIYPATMPPVYPYVNQCRVEPSLQPIYHQVIQQPVEEQKQSVQSDNNTFRIDPSYPYAPLEYASQCGACVDPNAAMHQQRAYSVPYPGVEVPAVLPQYSLLNHGNVILSQAHLPQHYPEQVQWAGVQQQPKLFVQELCPVYNGYVPQYNMLYPQVMPPPYPLCQPVFPLAEEPRSAAKAPSLSGSARTTPLPQPPPEALAYAEAKERAAAIGRQTSGEIAAKIQQIKEQMALRPDKAPKEDWRARNNGHGILGSYPAPAHYGRLHASNRPVNDETQLSSAARAIVNSIRNMQVKNQHELRRPETQQPHQPYNRSGDRQGERPAMDNNRHRQYKGFPQNNVLQQMPSGGWCRRSPAASVPHPVLNPRRPQHDSRNISNNRR